MTQYGMQQKEVQLTRKGDVTTVTFGAHKVEIDDAAKTVTAYTDKGIEMTTAATATAAGDGAAVSISENFNTVVLKGVSVGQAEDGHLVISADGHKVYNKPAAPAPLNEAALAAAVEAATPAATAEAPAAEKAAVSEEDNILNALTIGSPAEDGWFYVGRSVEDGKPLYVAPAHSGCMDFRDAEEAADKLKTAGKDNCRIPTIGELTQIFNNVQKLPQVENVSYWSSTRASFGRVKTGAIYKNTSFRSLDSHHVYVQKEKTSGKGHTALFVRN